MNEQKIGENIEIWQSSDEYRRILERAKVNMGRKPLTEVEMLSLLGDNVSRTYTYAERNYE